jgi:hypothetical protein
VGAAWAGGESAASCCTDPAAIAALAVVAWSEAPSRRKTPLVTAIPVAATATPE